MKYHQQNVIAAPVYYFSSSLLLSSFQFTDRDWWLLIILDGTLSLLRPEQRVDYREWKRTTREDIIHTRRLISCSCRRYKALQQTAWLCSAGNWREAYLVVLRHLYTWNILLVMVENQCIKHTCAHTFMVYCRYSFTVTLCLQLSLEQLLCVSKIST